VAFCFYSDFVIIYDIHYSISFDFFVNLKKKNISNRMWIAFATSNVLRLFLSTTGVLNGLMGITHHSPSGLSII